MLGTGPVALCWKTDKIGFLLLFQKLFIVQKLNIQIKNKTDKIVRSFLMNVRLIVPEIYIFF